MFFFPRETSRNLYLGGLAAPPLEADNFAAEYDHDSLALPGAGFAIVLSAALLSRESAANVMFMVVLIALRPHRVPNAATRNLLPRLMESN